jgi:DNA-binding transcriptional LysR family regulator
MNDVRLRRLDAGLLLVFEAVSRTGNFSHAAVSVGLSPSAVSHSVARLREIFDDPLFLRQAQGVTPTLRAKALRGPVANALGALRRALNEASDFKPSAIDRVFQIAALDAFIATLAPPLLARLASEAPGARIAFVTHGREETRKALLEGRADLALGVFEDHSQDFLAQSIGSESFVVVARRDHPLLAGGLSLEAWLACDHLIVSAAGDLVGAVDVALAARGLSRRTTAAMPQFLATFATLAASDATATVTQSLATAFAPTFGLAIHAPPIDLPPFQLTILRARPRAPDPALDWLVASIAELRAPLQTGRDAAIDV